MLSSQFHHIFHLWAGDLIKGNECWLKLGIFNKLSPETWSCYWLLPWATLNKFSGLTSSSSSTRLPFFQTAAVSTPWHSAGCPLDWCVLWFSSLLPPSSAGCRSRALPVQRPGAGLWRSPASRHPSGGNECHHDVSRKYPLNFSVS